MKCRTCGENKPIEAFSFASRGGMRPDCRKCVRASQKPIVRKKRVVPAAEAAAAKAQKILRKRAESTRRRLNAGGWMRGDGPCWCCRLPAFGSTEFRLCIMCQAAA